MSVDYVAQLRLAPRRPVQGLFARHGHPKAPLDEPPPIVARPDRWQKAGDESVLFLCDGEDTVWAEWRRKLSAAAGVDVTESVRLFGWIALSFDDVIDLRDPVVQNLLGITDADLTSDDTTTCHAILAAARVVGVDVLLAPSAARHGGTTVIVLPHVRKRVEVVSSERRVPPPAL
jgi:hypothetical protein